MEASPLQGLEEPSSRNRFTLPVPIDTVAASNSQFTTPQASPRVIPLPPPPNPPFVFPARPSSSSAPSSYSRATGRRPISAIESLDRTIGLDDGNAEQSVRSPALPEFSFNPGAAGPADKPLLLSPPLSPQSPRPIPSPARPGGHGHKRGGSEFVGGNIRSGEAITIMSTSPTKSESGFASPTFQPPPTGRRGHAHRRSAAISNHDLSLILQPASANVGARGSSAPTSPAEFGHLESPTFSPQEKTLKPVESEPILKRPVSADKSSSAPETPGRQTPSPQKPAVRARVGFSDTLEFIPRPLSLISSDTSSTMTARPGHSVSGSISSIMSTTPSAVERDASGSATRSPTRMRADSRPSTAGAVLERTQSIQSIEPTERSPRRRNSIPTLTSVPDPAGAVVGASPPSPTKTPKRWSFFGLEPFVASGSPTRPRPHSSSSTESAPKLRSCSATSSSEHVSDSVVETTEGGLVYHKRAGKKGMKKKKVKHWAGSILSRKAKPRMKKSKQARQRSPTPTTAMDVDSEEDGAEGSKVEPVIDSATPIVTITKSPAPTDASSWKPRSSGLDDDSAFPMIDLDAALGPFNTPLPHNPEWDAAQKAAGQAKRQLHSAQGMKGFAGPGMHYHRRAESAPEMVPFEGHRFGIHRFGSSSTMADVFEEDEEIEEDGSPTPASEVAMDEIKVDVQDVEHSSNGSATPPASTILASGPLPLLEEPTAAESSVRRVASGVSGVECRQGSTSLKSERSTTSFHEKAIPQEARSGEFRTGSIFQDTAGSSGSSTPSPRRILAGRELAPVEISPLQLPTQSQVPISPYSMSHTSSFPSPRSPISYDAQRISTAPSSVNDENNFQSLLMGEPGPEVRISVDDIPSLTSSNSTMTRDSSFAQNTHFPQGPFRDQRPASVSSAAFGRRRSSLASLSRLISSSHGERSKLSMEVTLDSESEKKPKVSKTKRLSRMMQFWKPKEATSG
jgi:hypothetical protein